MVTVITGATGAIGKALVQRFVEAGDTAIAICYHSHRVEAHDLVRYAEERGIMAVAVAMDLSSPESIATAFASIRKNCGHVHTLINNAGISLIKPLADTTPHDWERMLATNLSALYYTTREVLPAMSEHGGSIVNVGSMWGSLGASCEVAYSTTKAGVIGFTKALSQEYDGTLCVNAVEPGFVDSPMNAHLTGEEVAEFFATHPTMHMVTPAEVADTIYHVATSGVTGQVVKVGW